MEWKPKCHLLLLQEILVSEPNQYEVSTRERGKIWDEVTERLNASEAFAYRLGQKRAVIVYLREKAEWDLDLRKEELETRKRDQTQLLQQLQQQQMQLQHQKQQLQNQLLMTLTEKLSKN